MIVMAFVLYIPERNGECPCSPHRPELQKALRIQIEGPLSSIDKLLPGTTWKTNIDSTVFPQPAGLELAKLTYQKLYGQDVRSEIPGDMIVRDEYLGWVVEEPLR